MKITKGNEIEYEINEVFEDKNGIKLQCVAQSPGCKGYCIGCYYKQPHLCMCVENVACLEAAREDGKDVIFIEVKGE